MPPTALEIKARLDKSVDPEGNVLNMETVLEVVACLERFSMTSEALEATRIGLTINLMRKKTDNKDLAKRAKKLVRKWHTNHLQRTTNGGLQKRATEPIKKFDRPKSCVEELTKENLLKLHPSSPNNSPLWSHSPKHIVTSNLNSLSLKVEANSKLVKRSAPKTKASTSPKAKKGRFKLSDYALVKESKNASSNDNSNPPSVKSSIENSVLFDVFDRVASLKESSEDIKSHQNTPQMIVSENNHKDSSFHAIDSSSCDTRTREARAITPEKNSMSNACFNDKINLLVECDTTAENSAPASPRQQQGCDSTLNNLKPSENRTSDPSEKCHLASENDQVNDINSVEPNTGSPLSLEPEELHIVRRDLPEDIVSADSLADGVNGVYSNRGEWRRWEDPVYCRDDQLCIFPYVILE